MCLHNKLRIADHIGYIIFVTIYNAILFIVGLGTVIFPPLAVILAVVFGLIVTHFPVMYRHVLCSYAIISVGFICFEGVKDFGYLCVYTIWFAIAEAVVFAIAAALRASKKQQENEQKEEGEVVGTKE